MNLIVTTDYNIHFKITNPESFFEENKIILVVRDITLLNNRLQKYRQLITNEDDIMILSPYSLAYFPDNDNLYKQILTGPGNITDIISYIKQYYSRYYNINSIEIDKSNVLNDWQQKTIDILKSTKPEIKNSQKILGNKILFIPGNKVIYDLDDNLLFQGNKSFLRDYLKNGNFLVIFETSGNHIGIPFNILDKREYIAQNNLEMVEFYKSLNIYPIQVMSFKDTYVGISYDGSTCNLGWTSNNIKNFIKEYLEYLMQRGYKINEYYCIDRFVDYPIINSLSNFNYCIKGNVSLTEFGYEKVLK